MDFLCFPPVCVHFLQTVIPAILPSSFQPSSLLLHSSSSPLSSYILSFIFISLLPYLIYFGFDFILLPLFCFLFFFFALISPLPLLLLQGEILVSTPQTHTLPGAVGVTHAEELRPSQKGQLV